mmetsp:Transcript_70545/g.169008  ORF Transcript_70545/g.169008 Transcript_70545/m.169008 type:complete len:1398 (+) Transcript_70545:52-4245(+)
MESVETRLATKQISFSVNGKEFKLKAGPGLDPEQTVLEFLREKGLTGTKLACGEGGCGACTVVCSRRDHTGNVKHVSVNACLATVCEMHGAHITTAEGLANKNASVMHPIPKAMSDSHGSQCGYCTPGIVMSMYGLWLKEKEPTVRDIEEHFDGNLCRCTGYRPILHAFHQFATDQESFAGKDGPVTNTAPTRQCCGRKVPQSVGEDSAAFAEDLEKRLTEEMKTLPQPQPFLVQGEHLGQPCEWAQPTSVADVLQVMNSRTNVRLQVGNTERRVEKFFKWNHQYPMTLMSLSQVTEMQGLVWSQDEVRIGASMPLQDIFHAFESKITELGSSPQVQVLQAYCSILRWFAGHQIRNVAALGGNIATASPISDLNPCHMAAGAHLEVASLGAQGEVAYKKLPMGDPNAPFFTGYRKIALGAKEVIAALVLPLTKADGSEFYQAYKQARRRDDDLAIVNAAQRVRFKDDVVVDCCFAFGGMAPFSKACTKLATWWCGKEWTHSNFQDSMSIFADDLPLPDGAPGGMCEYRRTLARSFYFKFWAQVAYQRGGNQPPKPLSSRDMSAVLNHTTAASYHKPPAQGLQHYARDQTTLMQPQPVGSPDKHMAGDMHVTGHAKYTDDLPVVQGELFIDFVLSTKAHAKILKIDSSKAKKVEGFVELVTSEDIPGEKVLGPIAHDEEAIASEEVFCVGQIVAAVCATSRYAARVAAKAVVVEYEDLPAVVGLQDAIEKGSFFPLLFQNPGEDEAEIHTVDESASPAKTVEDIFKAANGSSELAIVEGEAFLGGQEHFYLETNATRVEPNENGEFNIISSSQNLHETQLLCSKALDVPMNKVTSQVKRLGGGFGGKESRCCLLSVVAAVAAKKVQRPVRFHLDRDVDQVVSGQRHSFIGKYRLLVNRNTLKFVAADMQLYCNGGYSLDLSQPILNRAMFHMTNACKVPSVRVRGHICKTNVPSNTAFRGFGGPQGMFMAEIMYEQAAREIGVTREDLLGANLYAEGDSTFFNHPLKPADVPLKRMWAQMMSQSKFAERQQAVQEFNKSNRYVKRGLAAVPTTFGISFTATHLNQAGALVHLQKDGTALVAHGGVEMGQGLHTKIARVAAATLNLPIEAIYVKETTTDTVANTSATAASSGSDLNGSAVMQACEELMQRLEPFLKKRQAMIDEDRRQDAMAAAVNEAYFARVNLTAQGYHRTPIRGVNWKQKGVNEFNGDPFWYYTYGVACSEVEIDCLTGDVSILRSDIVHDVGRTLNAAIDIGQVEGAFTQGVGLFMMEEVVFDDSGRLMSKGPGMYKIPGFGDVPLDLRVHLLEGHQGPAVLGSKAVGEPPLFLGSSVFFATKEAITAARRDFRAEQAGANAATGESPSEGYFRLDAPATAEKVRMACLDFMNPSGKVTHWHARA